MTGGAPGGSGALTWRPLAAADLGMLARWFAEPAIARWWCHDPSPEAVERDFGPSTRGEEPGEDLVVSLDGRPVGLVQRSVIADYPGELADFAVLVDVPDGAVEIDYLIADPARRGRGLGSRMIAALITDTWRALPHTHTVLVSVVATNIASWRALEKVGLTRVGVGDMEPENPLDPPLHFIYRIDRARR